jgi:hypothetical protein
MLNISKIKSMLNLEPNVNKTRSDSEEFSYDSISGNLKADVIPVDSPCFIDKAPAPLLVR